MAKAIFNSRIYLGEVDLSGDSNVAALNCKINLADSTTMKTGSDQPWKESLPGIKDAIADISGFNEILAVTGNPDKKMFDQFTTSDAIFTIAQGDGSFGNRAWFFRPEISEYQTFGKVGDINPFKLHAEGDGQVIRGRVLAANTARTLTGAGTKYNLGAYSATQFLYGALHIFAVSGTPTLDATIAIADRISTATINAAGSGYSENDVLTVVQSGGSYGTFTVTSVGGSGEVTGISAVTTPGSGYAVANGLSTTVSPANGTGCKLNITAITDTTVITFTQASAIGQQWVTDAGPITDVNFKAKWTIGGGTPSITFAIVAGIA